jgi:hypothetical protein
LPGTIAPGKASPRRLDGALIEEPSPRLQDWIESPMHRIAPHRYRTKTPQLAAGSAVAAAGRAA